VEKGTARRAYRAFRRSDGTAMVLGGKTGTGDNRRDIYGRRGQLIESKVINRTATFVFFIGNRFFGTITVYVPGQAAARYGFTSSLPVQLLKVLAPKLMPLIERIDNVPQRVSTELEAKRKKETQPPVDEKLMVRLPAKQPEAEEKAKYTVKVGTFSSQKSAENLADLLKSSGYKSWLKSESLAGKTVYHVLVGEFDSVDKAKQFGNSLQEKSSYVTDYMIKEIQKGE